MSCEHKVCLECVATLQLCEVIFTSEPYKAKQFPSPLAVHLSWYFKLEIKRQLYNGPFPLREAASFIFLHWMTRLNVALPCLYFIHSCTKLSSSPGPPSFPLLAVQEKPGNKASTEHSPWLLPSRSEATPTKLTDPYEAQPILGCWSEMVWNAVE